MRRYGMVIAIGLLVLTNSVVFVGAAYNRSDGPNATVLLTEREVPLSSYYGYADRENTGLSLRLDWSRGRTWFGPGPFIPRQRWRKQQAEWFDKTKLQAIGFDCTMPLDDPRAEIHYQKLLPRKTFAVLEYEGKAWEAWHADVKDDFARMERQIATGEVSRKELNEARQEYEREARTRSRLFAVDVGNDPSALRGQYSNREQFLILPATVRLYYHQADKDLDGKKTPPHLEGSIDNILTDDINVPKPHRALLEKLLRADRKPQVNTVDFSPYSHRQRDPAYAVTLCVGKRHEPWIKDLRALTTPERK